MVKFVGDIPKKYVQLKYIGTTFNAVINKFYNRFVYFCVI